MSDLGTGFVSEGCIESGQRGGGVLMHEYNCNGYADVKARSAIDAVRRYCECWCHEWEAEGLVEEVADA